MTNINVVQSMVSRDKQLKSEIQSSEAFLRWSEFSKRDVAWKVKHDPEAQLEQELVGELNEDGYTKCLTIFYPHHKNLFLHPLSTFRFPSQI